MPSRTKSPIRIKQCNAQGSTKPLQRTYITESMESDTDHIVASLNLEEIINNYNTWNHLIVDKLISSLTFFNINLLHICIYLTVWKQMTDVKLLLLHSNSNHLFANKWGKVNRMICTGKKYLKSFNCEGKWAQVCFKMLLEKCSQTMCI